MKKVTVDRLITIWAYLMHRAYRKRSKTKDYVVFCDVFSFWVLLARFDSRISEELDERSNY